MGLILWLTRLWPAPRRDAVADLAITFAERLSDDIGTAGPALNPRERAAFDRLMDGLNRLPRPFMALGSLALIGAAMVAPVWFANRMEALAAMPDALWWLIGAVISLYFGARFQTHAQDFQRDLVHSVVRQPVVAPPPAPTTPRVAETGADAALALRASVPGDNSALVDWHLGRAVGT